MPIWSLPIGAHDAVTDWPPRHLAKQMFRLPQDEQSNTPIYGYSNRALITYDLDMGCNRLVWFWLQPKQPILLIVLRDA
jgi:hypothetical protein